MNKKLISGVVLTGILAAAGTVGVATAQSTFEQPKITMAQAVERALAEVPGEVLEVELEREHGMAIYQVEIRNADGRQMEIDIDANSGKVLEIEMDDDYGRKS